MPTSKLRQDTVRTLPYTGEKKSQCVYWDESLSGFGLRIYSGGKRTYVCSYRVSLRERLATLGRADALTLDEARKKARRYLGQVADKSDPQAQSDADRSAVTCKLLVQGYMEKHAKPKKRTWRNDQSILNEQFLAKFSTRTAVSITSEEIETMHLKKGETAKGAANTFIKIVRKMYNWGRKIGPLPKNAGNPAAGITPFPSAVRTRYVKPAEMPQLLNALEAEENEYARHAIWLLLLTGLRRNELLRAKWSDLDWDNRTIHIGITKTDVPVLTPLSDAALDRLRRIPRIDDNPYIICGSKPGKSLVNLYEVWVRIRKAAGLPDVRLHDLRRTVASWLVQGGSTLHLVGAVLNHQDPKTTAGYAYFQTQQREQALTEYGRKLLQFLPPGSETARPAYEVETVKELPAAVLRMPNRAHYLERKTLYHLVWEAPVSEVARRFGISDVALAKACRRVAIPIPGRGYWARVDAGMRLNVPRLPPTPAGLSSRIRIRGKKPRGAPSAAADITTAIDAQDVPQTEAA